MSKKKPGRPKKPPGRAKTRYLQVRVEEAEKEGFDTAADLAGLPLSTWVRERLRTIARRELEEHGETVSFLQTKRRPGGRK